eukprot:364863-Chlamydomonas_euryale.AAC.4
MAARKKKLADPQWAQRPQDAGLLGRQLRSTKAKASASLSTNPGCSVKGGCWPYASIETAPAVLSTLSYSFIIKTTFQQQQQQQQQRQQQQQQQQLNSRAQLPLHPPHPGWR